MKNFQRNTLNFQQFELARRCMYRLGREQRGYRGHCSLEVQRAKVVGRAVERATATSDVHERAKLVLEQLRQLPEEERRSAAETIVTFVARADELSDPNVDLDKQPQFSWRDPETGWTLYAKPDEVQYIYQSRSEIIRIIDEKTGSHLTSRIKRGLFFFALVVSKTLHERRVSCSHRRRLAQLVPRSGFRRLEHLPSLQLVARLLGDRDGRAREEEFWYQRSREAEQLEEVRRVIALITKARNTGEYPTKKDWDCDRCPYRKGCPAFAIEDNEVGNDDLFQIA